MQALNLLNEMVSSSQFVEFKIGRDALEHCFRKVIKEETGVDVSIYLNFDEQGEAMIHFPCDFLESLSEEDYEKLSGHGFEPELEAMTLDRVLCLLFNDYSSYHYVNCDEDEDDDTDTVCVVMSMTDAKKVLILDANNSTWREIQSRHTLDEAKRSLESALTILERMRFVVGPEFRRKDIMEAIRLIKEAMPLGLIPNEEEILLKCKNY